MSSQSPDRDLRLDETAHSPILAQVDVICDRFVRDWRSGRQPRIEEYLGEVPAAGRSMLLLELLCEEIEFRRQSGEYLSVDHYLSRFPRDCDTVGLAFASTDEQWKAASTSSPARSFEEQTHAGTSVPDSASGMSEPANQRYRRIRELGKGAFGTVWLAEDLELRRQVAIKEPRADRLRTATDIEAYLAEARVLASLDHPHIVPVYDVGRTAEGSCYVVSKLIEGMDLAAYRNQKPLSFGQTAELVAHVADALQQTHSRGLVHRDLKPGNILMDGHGRPYVTDFGLALREEDLGKGHGIAGTPAYMSPEQARGEGHLVDGRSDIFSLGVVLYELLTGTKPFNGANWGTLQVQITTMEPRPLRQRSESIPKELERICLKALSKRPADRYSCAADLAEDLRHWSSTPAAASEANPTLPDPLSSRLNDQPANQPTFTGNNNRASHWPLIVSVLAFVIVLGVGVWWRVQPKPPNHEAASNPDTSTKSPEDSTPVSTDLRIVDFEIKHFALRDDGNVNEPLVFGKTSFAARQRDKVQLKLELSRPAYTYLIAFRPDGVVELCYPEDETVSPPLSEHARYPSEAASRSKAYGLNEAPGLWIFTSIVSEKPLPPFAQWKTEHQLLSLQGAKGIPGVVLVDDGKSIDHWTASGPVQATRGKGDDLPGQSDIETIDNAVKKAAPTAILRSIGFVAEPLP